PCAHQIHHGGALVLEGLEKPDELLSRLHGVSQIVVAGLKAAHANQNASTCWIGASRRPVSGPAVAVPKKFQREPVSRSRTPFGPASNVSARSSSRARYTAVAPTARDRAICAASRAESVPGAQK